MISKILMEINKLIKYIVKLLSKIRTKILSSYIWHHPLN